MFAFSPVDLFLWIAVHIVLMGGRFIRATPMTARAVIARVGAFAVIVRQYFVMFVFLLSGLRSHPGCVWLDGLLRRAAFQDGNRTRISKNSANTSEVSIDSGAFSNGDSDERKNECQGGILKSNCQNC